MLNLQFKVWQEHKLLIFRFVRLPLQFNYYKGEFVFIYIKTLFSLTSTAKKEMNKQFDKLKINNKKNNKIALGWDVLNVFIVGKTKQNTTQPKHWNVTILDCHLLLFHCKLHWIYFTDSSYIFKALRE